MRLTITEEHLDLAMRAMELWRHNHFGICVFAQAIRAHFDADCVEALVETFYVNGKKYRTTNASDVDLVILFFDEGLYDKVRTMLPINVEYEVWQKPQTVA